MDELNPTVREQEIYEEMELTPDQVHPDPLCDLSAAFRRSQGFQNRSRAECGQEYGHLHRLPDTARSRLCCHAPLMPVLHSNHRGGDAYCINKTAFIF